MLHIRQSFSKTLEPFFILSLRFVNDADVVLQICDSKLVVNLDEDVETLARIRERLIEMALAPVDQTDVLIFVSETSAIADSPIS